MNGISYAGAMRLFAGGIIIFILSGCAGMIPSFTKPEVTVSDLGIAEIKAFESKFIIDLRIINPNDFPLTVKGISCSLAVNEQKFGTGVSNIETEISAFETAVVSVTVYSSMVNFVKGLLKLSTQKNLTYEISGILRTLTKGVSVPISVPFEHAGTLDTKDLN
ncbi:MAG: LEA type 2 family protein [Syntrophales bacterium]|jgi:LEA14-like dessication related protein|nr:LEA type 2 family protein [Syntrophales bacterium]MDY0044884.1 LEA type 2 family protein [Syntrophales bacterium]